MASYKRRRGINVDVAYIEALSKALKSHPEKGLKPTGLASQIFKGEAKPIRQVAKSGKTKGVSMTEALWLSIRRRAVVIGQSATQAAQSMLTGDEPPLTPREIDYGLERAREREQKRAAGVPEEVTEPPSPTEFESEPEHDEQSETVKELREMERERKNVRDLKLSDGHRYEQEIDDSRKEKKLGPGEDFYGGIFSI